MSLLPSAAMADLNLRTVTRAQGNNRALLDGTVTPKGAGFEFVDVPVLVQGFRRMVRTLEFDVCEMALTTYLTAKAHGVAFTAVPAFLVRGFHHNAITVDTRHGISQPKDLEGRKVGVNRGYTVTTGVWARSILAGEYGVDLDSVTWVLSGDEHVAEYRPPANVVPAPAGRTLDEMLTSEELAAVVGVEIDSADTRPLIPHPDEAAHAALQQRGLWPINHLVVIRDELLAEHPDLGRRVFDAFAESKHGYVQQLRAGTLPQETATDRMHRTVMELTGWDDPLPYGIEPNRQVLEDLIRSAVDQKILDRAPRIEDAFTPDTRDVVA
ncbi:ABC transporter substrate-binding protein [Modestobacter muralis]|uniref:ABC transporter substrate-binding protein n=2 Tax=Modestobacter muralis TaxID=1608614 RepID=A0A6P0H8C5_9ACTN|nr:ABC transporter substrate-binding protein [Modestobacter muralis]NEN52087.1 ABC transporter substrate-binding protein [Modestobacter muralis]